MVEILVATSRAAMLLEGVNIVFARLSRFPQLDTFNFEAIRNFGGTFVVTMEVRYIVFTVEETRKAIVSFVRRQHHDIQENIKEFEIIGHNEFPSVVVHLPGSPIVINTSDLVGLLLLYCRDHHIPVPQRSQKNVHHSSSGLTLVLRTTDTVEGGAPLVVDGRITYGDDTMAQELRAVRQELTRAIARAEEAERKAAEAGARVTIAEKASAEAAAIAPAASGLRGWALRLLIDSKQSA